MFYGVENKENMIAGVIGYDSIRKHLAECAVRGKRNTICEERMCT
jgi:hypothetical protein